MLPSTDSHLKAKKPQKITSLELAQLSGKHHYDLLKSIRKQEVSWTKVTQGKFTLSKYTDSTGRKLTMYELTKPESLYIASKFDDEIRAKLVVRWMELEQAQQGKPKRITLLREDERKLLDLLSKYLIPGDMNKIAYDLKVNRRTVNGVKSGKTRSARILTALVDRALYNKRTGRQLVIGYDQRFVRESLAKLSHES